MEVGELGRGPTLWEEEGTPGREVVNPREKRVLGPQERSG